MVQLVKHISHGDSRFTILILVFPLHSNGTSRTEFTSLRKEVTNNHHLHLKVGGF